jgi:cellulose synthase/poly-beta-1,6-N-acetylglucosamine synthase-like glycosyltransferase
MHAPCLSIIMPVFNAAPTLRRALESLRRQTFRDWELVVADDGSSDETPAILAASARQEPRLRVVSLPHAGIVSALNSALALARGSLIARMDADDESHPERLAAQFEFLQLNPRIGLAGCLVAFGGEARTAGGYALHVDWMNRLLTPDEIALNRFIESPFAHPSVVFRRALLEKHGGYQEGEFPEDYELWLRWMDAGVAMGKVPNVLLTWNDLPGRLSRTEARYDLEAFYRCKAIYLARWLKRHLAPDRLILAWGAGRLTRKRLEYLSRHGVRISGYIDIDPHKQGRTRDGRKVFAPDHVPLASEVFVLGYVAKRGARELARARLGDRGFVEGRDFLIAA